MCCKNPKMEFSENLKQRGLVQWLENSNTAPQCAEACPHSRGRKPQGLGVKNKRSKGRINFYEATRGLNTNIKIGPLHAYSRIDQARNIKYKLTGWSARWKKGGDCQGERSDREQTKKGTYRCKQETIGLGTSVSCWFAGEVLRFLACGKLESYKLTRFGTMRQF